MKNKLFHEWAWTGDSKAAATFLGLASGAVLGPVLGVLLGIWIAETWNIALRTVPGLVLGTFLIPVGWVLGFKLGAKLGVLLNPVLRIPVLGTVLVMLPALAFIPVVIQMTTMLEGTRKVRLATFGGTMAGAVVGVVIGIRLGEALGAILGVLVGIWLASGVLLLLEKHYGVFV